ncbi:MAG TPA: HEAT repeat domain-containing protein [Solirubrobacterales bacterium]
MTESAGDPVRPTAFVSYAQGGGDWQKTVFQFTTALRRVGGIDAELDLFHGSDHRQWTTFGPNLIDKSDFTLVAVDPAYKRRWEGEEAEGVGAGAAREAAAIKAIFERSQDEALRRVKVVLLPGSNEGDIPSDLFGFSERFVISAFDSAGLETLLRSLWEKPAFPKPALGPIPVLPPLAIAELQDHDGEDATELRIPAGGEDASKIDERDRDTLTKRLDEVDQALQGRKAQASRPGEQSLVTEDLEREVAILRTSLEALTEAQASVERTDQGDAAISAALRPFLAGLDDSDESVRFEAMSALGDRLEPSLLPRIEGLLDDRDPYIRRYALEYYSLLTK